MSDAQVLNALFDCLRKDKSHHLGLGDIRLTLAQQDDICNRLAAAERQLQEWKDAYTRDIAAAATRLREAQERSEYWKAEHLAGNREIDTLKERCERLEGAINEAFDCATLGHAENVLRDALTPGASDEPR